MRALSALSLLPLLAMSIAAASTDSVQVSLKSIHSAHRNWLQVQAEPVGGCQEIVVDSVRVLDERIRSYQALLDSATGLILVYETPVLQFGRVPRRDLKLSWRLGAMTSTNGCSGVKAARHMLVAKKDWLLFLDSTEARTGVLGLAFKRDYCGIRANAKAVVNDSVFLGGVWIPMALLDQVLDVPSAARRGPVLRISVVPSGLRVAQEADLTEFVMIRVRTVSGRQVAQALLASREMVLPVSGHGIFLIEAELSRGVTVSRAVR